MIKAFFATLGVLAALVFVFVLILVLGGALAEHQGSAVVAPLAEQDAQIADKNQRLRDLYQSTYETIVREPSRPMADFYQPVLEMHYLWLDVRDSSYWVNRPEERKKMDLMITKLVDQVSRDKKVRDAFAGQ